MTTRLADVIVPEIFTPYTTTLTAEKSNIIRSGAVVMSPQLNSFLAGEGLTANVRSFRDLANDEENISNDDPNDFSTPNKITSLLEIQVRLSRNNSWSSMDLVDSLMSPDPMLAISNLVSSYWVRRQQLAFMATARGVFANNALPTDANHTQNDMIHDISGASFVDGVTNMNARAFCDTLVTNGDSMQELTMMLVHSIVYNTMLKEQMIEFITVSINQQAVKIPTYLGRTVIVDDGMPHTGGLFDTYIFGAQAFLMGSGSAKVPTEVARIPGAGKGAGQEVLYNRVEWSFHPSGYAYIGPLTQQGGPANTTLALASSWQRVFPERKQIRMAKLVTREY